MQKSGRKRARDLDSDDDSNKQRNKNLLLKKLKKKHDRKDWKSKQRTVDSVVLEYKEMTERDAISFRGFNDFPLSDATLKGLDEQKFSHPTEIQRDSLPYSLSGSDLVGAAKTGSGKTLALVIPLLECLWRNRWTREDGLGALVISPTRELALQTFGTINKVGKYHDFSCCLLIGGGLDVEFEKTRLRSMNIVVCTPGRLLQHIDENYDFSVDQLQLLVIDEADRILDMGFAQQINAIVEALPVDRQTLLFSATQTRNVKDLSRVCSKDPVFVSVHEKATNATPDQLKQLYLLCEEEEKINTVWSFITNHRKAKTLMFVTTCKQARFLTESFSHLLPGLPLMGLWGNMKQGKRIEVFEKFERSKFACMIATDVASRGLDFSNVDWVVQMDAPAQIDDYIHRVGRTARMNKKGQALLVLTPYQEPSMVKIFETRNIPVSKMQVDPRSLKDIKKKLQSTIAHFPELNGFSQRAFVSYIRSVYIMKNKDVFNVEQIHTKELAESMGLISIPRIRFLSKQGINLNDKTVESSHGDEENNFVSGSGFGDEIDDLEEEDIFTVKNKNVFNVSEDSADQRNAETEMQDDIISKAAGTNKVIRREKMIKKMLKNGVKNKKIVFDADDNETEEKSNSVGGPSLGLDIEEAIRIKKEQDKSDKKEHRRKLRDLKMAKLAKKTNKGKTAQDEEVDLGAASDEGMPDLDWLPKPIGYESGDDDDLPAEFDPAAYDEYLSKKSTITKPSVEKESKNKKYEVKSKKKKKIESVQDAESQALALLNPF